MAKRVDYEERFYIALKRITSYMTLAQLRRESSGRYGLEHTEALEMAYENVKEEAKDALRGYKRKKVATATPSSSSEIGSVPNAAPNSSSPVVTEPPQ